MVTIHSINNMLDNKLRIEDPSKLFFTSDLHLGHKNIIQYCNRPYETTDEMDSNIIDVWNNTVSQTSIVVFGGDFSLSLSKSSLINELNGQIYMVRGNHDNSKHIKIYAGKCEKIVDILRVIVGKQLIVVTHYPMIVWENSHYGSWHLHGHCHGSLKKIDNNPRLDIGWDVWNMPLSYERVRQLLQPLSYNSNDHH